MGTNLPRITLAVTPEQLAWLNDQTAPLRNKSVVVRDLIDSAMQGVDTSVTLTERATAFPQRKGGASEVSSSTSIKENTSNRSSKKKKDPFSSKHLPDSIQVPDDLIECDALLREFWANKKGTRSENTWNRLCAKLRPWSPDDRRKALEAAADSGWATVYEPKPDRQFGKPQQKMSLTEEARSLGLI